MALCECGCGKEVKPGCRFIAQHHMRGRKLPPEWIASMKKGAKSRPPVSDITRKRISESKLREKLPLSNGWEVKGGSITTNKDCADYLGCFVAERLLSKIYPDVKVMPHGNHGFDFICNRDMKIDVKSSATGYKGYWMFYIAKNQIADYFLCIAFEDREDLNPAYLWLIPGGILSNQ